MEPEKGRFGRIVGNGMVALELHFCRHFAPWDRKPPDDV